MKALATVVRKIMFTHLPKDGRTPTYNSTLNKWELLESPTNAQLDATVQKMTAIENSSANAVSQATIAKAAADTAQEAAVAAQQTADSKPSVTDIQSTLFPATNKDGKTVTMTTLTFVQDDSGAWTMQFCFQPVFGGSPMCAKLGYALSSELRELKERVAALEAKLGSSS